MKDQSGNPLATRGVQIRINGASYANVTTGTNGQASLAWQPNSVANYTITASYSPTGTADIGYGPSSASVIVFVNPKPVINSQTAGSVTQSVAFHTAQGSAQLSTNAPSISIQFSSNGVTIIASFEGVSIKASALMTTQLKIVCVLIVRTFFGSFCAMVAPVELITLDLSLNGIIDLHIEGELFGGIQRHTIRILAPAPGNIPELADALGNGVDVSTGIAAAGTATLATITGVSLGTAFLAAEDIAALVVAGGMGVATAAGFAYGWKTPTFKSYLLGLFTPAVFGLVCVFSFLSNCLAIQDFDIPQVLPNYVVANATWSTYEIGGVAAPYLFGDLSPVLIWAAALLIPAVVLSFQG